MRFHLLSVLVIMTVAPLGHARAAAPVPVVAAERVWADLAQQVGGDQVATTAVLASPTIDPHLFEVSPQMMRAMASARIVIANGAGYDPWMPELLGARGAGPRTTLVVASLLPWGGSDPHLWFDTHYARALAARVADELARQTGTPVAVDRLRAVLAALDALDARIAALRVTLGGQSVAATEPLVNRLLVRLGLDVREVAFQRAVQNDTEPGPRDVAAFESDLRARRVRLVVRNSQVETPATGRLCALARRMGIPVVTVSETLPDGMRYQDWIGGVLDDLARALAAEGAR